jgi:hypothetical protein
MKNKETKNKYRNIIKRDKNNKMSEPELKFMSPRILERKDEVNTIIPTFQQLEKLQATGDPVGITEIPPMNAELNFTAFLPEEEIDLTKLKAEILPPSWNWGKIEDDDSVIVKAKKRLISPVVNQGLCGSCWAVSLSSAISDRYVVAGRTNKNPGVSITYLLSCFQNRNACNGGNPAEAANQIQKNGVALDNCINYDVFCRNENGCRKDPRQHFDAPKGGMNATLPICGCIDPNIEHLLLFIDKPVVSSVPQQEAIKSEIYNKGTIVGGYHVFLNFLEGAKTNFKGTGGVYLENYKYNDDGTATFDPTQTDPTKYFKGSHAVAVTGWGSDEIELPSVGKQKINYWIVRNSWGATWADKGYFKMAWYGTDKKTSNQISQFDKSVTLMVPIGGSSSPFPQFSRAQTAGFIYFNTGEVKKQKIQPTNVPKESISDPSFFATTFDLVPLKVGEEEPKKEEPKKEEPKKEEPKKEEPKKEPKKEEPKKEEPKKEMVKKPFYKQLWFMILVIIILVGLIGLGIYLIFGTGKKKQKKRRYRIDWKSL